MMLVPGIGMARQTFDSHGANLEIITQKAGSEKVDAKTFAARVIQIGFSVSGLVFLVIMVYAGFRWMTARGEEEMVNKARNTIIGAVFGLIFIVGAYAITSFITTRVIDGKVPAGSSTQAPTLGGEPLGCCADRFGTTASIKNYTCKISTESTCKTKAKVKTAGDVFTEYKWIDGLSGNECKLECEKLIDIDVGDYLNPF